MVKKRLADMIQEEAQKFTPTEGEPVIEVTATPVNSPVNDVKESDEISVNILADQELSTDATEQTSPKHTSPTKAELEATVKELKDTLVQLEESQFSLEKENNSLQKESNSLQKENNSLQKENNTLQKQNTDLQASLSEQKSLAEKLKKELHDTKKDALHLAEANSKLVEQMNAFKREEQEEQEKQETQQKLEKQQKEIVHKPSSLNYKKSHRTVERLATSQPHIQEEKEEFGADTSSQMWLLD
jgi:chromosome segregation ATPase